MHEFDKKFQFFINKIENHTYHISEILQNSNSSVNTINPSGSISDITNTNTADAYDSSGAAKYIVVVVLVYGFGIIFFIGSQVKSGKKVSDEVDEVNAEKILRSMETEIFTREVLEKLSDKNHRERAWNIYLGDRKRRASQISNLPFTTTPASIYTKNNNLKTIDKNAVENIQKKLKILNRLQSSYRGEYKNYEIETVKEVLVQPKRKRLNSLNAIEHRLRPNQRVRNLINKIRLNSAKKQQATIDLNTRAPLLILQTDCEGLHQYRETYNKHHHHHHHHHQDNISMSLIDLSQFSSKGTASTSSANDSDTMICFDYCEVTEQVTTV